MDGANARLAQCLKSVLNVKSLVGTFNQEKALVGAFSVIAKTNCETDDRLQHYTTHSGGVPSRLNCSNSTCTRSPAQGHKRVRGCIRTVHILWNQKLPGSALKLYVHCLTWPSGLRKFGATKVPFFDLMFVVEMKFWSQAAIKR